MLSFCTLCVTLLLSFGCSVAQDSVIEVGFDNIRRDNNEIFLTIPPVSRVVFVSTVGISFNSEGEFVCEEGSNGPHPNCTLLLNQSTTSDYSLMLESSFNGSETSSLTVTVSINSNYSVGCSPYVFPARIDLTDNTGEINCIPVFVNSSLSASSITWYKSSEMTGENLTLVDSTRVNFQNSSGVMNAFIVFRMASEEDGAYYFPVTAAIGIDRINEIQPILVTYRPRITSAIAEFSRELYIDPNFPQDTTFSCTVVSFPPAYVTWRFHNTSTQKNSTLMCDNSDKCTTGMVKANNEYIYNITIFNVGFDDSGIYSCFPGNEAFRAEVTDPSANHAHSYHLRIKDHLRPLWPAVGTLVVAFVLVGFMLVGTLWDKLIAKLSIGEDSSSSSKANSRRNRSSTSTSSGSPDGAGKLTGDHVALRRLSSAKIQLLEEPN